MRDIFTDFEAAAPRLPGAVADRLRARRRAVASKRRGVVAGRAAASAPRRRAVR